MAAGDAPAALPQQLEEPACERPAWPQLGAAERERLEAREQGGEKRMALQCGGNDEASAGRRLSHRRRRPPGAA